VLTAPAIEHFSLSRPNQHVRPTPASLVMALLLP
jgi:hypothetical protein